MREINFRGKRIDNWEWVFGSYHNCVGNATLLGFDYFNAPKNKNVPLNKHWILEHCLPDSVSWSIHNTFYAYDVIAETIGQYTGANDKDGKGIYYGDLVVPLNINSETVYRIIFSTITKSVVGVSEIENESMPIDEFHLGKIVGNVFDNPEVIY